MAHLERPGFTTLKVAPEPADRFAGHRFALRPDPVQVATEGALWGSVQAHECLCDAVIPSDDAGQFNIGRHALCWAHAERLVHKPEVISDASGVMLSSVLQRPVTNSASRSGITWVAG